MQRAVKDLPSGLNLDSLREMIERVQMNLEEEKQETIIKIKTAFTSLNDNLNTKE